jgi:hypothetical protein
VWTPHKAIRTISEIVVHRLWPSFWASLASMIPPSGLVGVVDETDEGVDEKERWTADPDCAARQLSDGREYTVVKPGLDPPTSSRR